jgi:hypothetical protein
MSDELMREKIYIALRTKEIMAQFENSSSADSETINKAIEDLT